MKSENKTLIQQDKEQFQIEENDLFKVVLTERFFKPWTAQGQDDFFTVPKGHVEIYITSQCNQHCEYCYLVRHPELYPKEFLDKDLILTNLKALYTWFLNSNFCLPDIEFYSGEIWHSQFGYDVLDITLEYLEKGLMVDSFMIPSNCSFVQSKEKTEIIQNYIDKFQDHGARLGFSISVDGKIVDNDIRANNNSKVKYTDEFYDNLFEFVKYNEFGFHPMVAAADIDKWCDNVDWWIETLEKHGMNMSRVMMLEVRNPDWTDETIEEFIKFDKYLISKVIENNNNDIGKVCQDIFGINQTYLNKNDDLIIDEGNGSYTPYHLSEANMYLGCSLQNTLTIRLGDLALCPCHRTAYNKNLLGWLVKNEQGEINDIKSNNTELAIRTYLVNNSTATLGCDNCFYNKYCMTTCCGEQMEEFSDMFHLDQRVCHFLKSKFKFLILYYKELGLLDWMEENITPYHVFYPNLQSLLKFYNEVIEEEEKNGKMG